MKIVLNPSNQYYSRNKIHSHHEISSSPASKPLQKTVVNFKGNIFEDAIRYAKARSFANALYNMAKKDIGLDKFVLKNYKLEPLEGIQTGIKVFKGLSIKDIQYMSDNLHVIAVKRGCNNMCGHCYADAKPSKREMSYEDFHSIMKGYKTLRKRMHNLDLFGLNQPRPTKEPIYKTTELFYDADCMDILLKDKKGREYDFIDLADELYSSLGRTTVFDTAGWHPNNKKAQERAFKYAKHFSDPKNMEKLEDFNVSFNVFNASYIASQKALKRGDKEKALRLRDKFTTKIANTLFTFTPLAENPKFHILVRAFNSAKTKHSTGYNEKDMLSLIIEVENKLKNLYQKDFEGEQIYIKSPIALAKYKYIMKQKLSGIDTSLNSAGRMKRFVEDNKIKTNTLQDHDKTTPAIEQMLRDNPRLAGINCIMHRLIDADGKVYHMDYARFFPTEIQLNISGKDTPTPPLANLKKDFVITKLNINS